MSARTTEYVQDFIVTRDQLYSMKKAQYYMRIKGFTNTNEDALINNLSAFTGVLSFAFMLPTPVSLAAGIISALSAGITSISAITSMSIRGEDYLQNLVYILDEHPEIEQLKISMPCLEFVDQNFRILTGYGSVLKVRAYHEWVYPGYFPNINWSI